MGRLDHPDWIFQQRTFFVYSGEVEHRDSTGAGGIIRAGDIQWMTAASGLVHEEFHAPEFAKLGGPFEMVQLWVNLPAKDKMSAPGYQGIKKESVPEIKIENGRGVVRDIAGEFNGCRGPAKTFTPMNIWDVRLDAGTKTQFEIPEGFTTLCFLLKGKVGLSGADHAIQLGDAELAVMEREETTLELEASESSTLLLLSGKPIDEPVVGHGPFVMNTRAEIKQAIDDFQKGKLGQISGKAVS